MSKSKRVTSWLIGFASTVVVSVCVGFFLGTMSAPVAKVNPCDPGQYYAASGVDHLTGWETIEGDLTKRWTICAKGDKP